jgi:hypothetical protein
MFSWVQNVRKVAVVKHYSPKKSPVMSLQSHRRKNRFIGNRVLVNLEKPPYAL